MIEDRHVDLPGGRVFVRRWRPAAPRAAPLVLLHESLGCVEAWRDVPPALAQRLGREVIAYDRLGFGRSDARTRRPSLDFIGEEAQTAFPALRDALGLDFFALLGHSVGGTMALAIAGAAPQRCEAVVSVSAQAFVEPGTLDAVRRAQSEFRQPALYARLARRHGEKTDWVLDAWFGVWLDPAFAGWTLDADLARVRCPVLAIHGDRDEYGSAAFPRRIVAGVAGRAEMVLVNDCGHVPHRERAAEVLSGVERFLARDRAQRA